MFEVDIDGSGYCTEKLAKSFSMDKELTLRLYVNGKSAGIVRFFREQNRAACLFSLEDGDVESVSDIIADGNEMGLVWEV